MSQRALKKRELNLHKQDKEPHQIYRKQPQVVTALKSKYTQRTNQTYVLSKKVITKPNQIDSVNKSRLCASQQIFSSTPNLTIAIDEFFQRNSLARCHSESDLSTITEANALVNAKSEFHLKSIASTQVPMQNLISKMPTDQNDGSVQKSTKNRPMENPRNARESKRMSIQSGMSSQTGSSMTSSASESPQPPTVGFVDTDNIRIPIVGYEVMEERARFTVYKLRVENPFTNDCWLVLRRYTDFQRLNSKLKSTFPLLPSLILPRKKLFGDNFSSLFLSNRVRGLQLFINSVMANETLRSSQPVRDFFCLDEPPAYSESIEECRAIFEAQEDTINHLKMQLRAKNEIILSMQQQINREIEKNCALSTAIKYSYDNCTACSKRFDELMKCQSMASNSK